MLQQSFIDNGTGTNIQTDIHHANLKGAHTGTITCTYTSTVACASPGSNTGTGTETYTS